MSVGDRSQISPPFLMAPRIDFDPVPQAVAGVMTMKCDCGWEMVFVQPEEHLVMLEKLFGHLINKHLLQLPEIRVEWH